MDADFARDLYYNVLWTLDEHGPSYIAQLQRRIPWRVSYPHVRETVLCLVADGHATTERRYVVHEDGAIGRLPVCVVSLTEGGGRWEAGAGRRVLGGGRWEAGAGRQWT